MHDHDNCEECAARVQALAAERDEQRAIITQLRGTLHVCPKQQKAEAERDAARAELAAANARCAELEAKVEGYSYWSMVQKNAALQATLDRVTAATDGAVYADFGQHHPHDGDDEEVVLAVRESELRAALTPEGKHVNCNCDDCDEERSLDPTPKGRP